MGPAAGDLKGFLVSEHIGRTDVAAQFTGEVPHIGVPEGSNTLSLSFVTPSGDTLVLLGSGPTPTFSSSGVTGTGTWTADSSASTGRFARATGSGTYTATFTFNGIVEDPYSFGTLTVDLSGNFVFGAI